MLFLFAWKAFPALPGGFCWLRLSPGCCCGCRSCFPAVLLFTWKAFAIASSIAEVNACRCGGFPGCRPLSCVGGPFDIAMVVNKPTAGKGDHLKQRKRKPFGKSGHCVLQTRPPGVKSGQYLPPVLARLGKINPPKELYPLIKL